MSLPDWPDLPRWKVPFNWPLFFRKQGTIIRRSGLGGGRAGRIASLLGLVSVNQMTWLADQVMSPNWDKVKLNGPVFIIGHQRSGSTLLHRTLARDPNALALTLREMLLPAVAGQGLIAAVGRLDARLGGRMAKRLQARQDRASGALESIHELRLDAIEEDEFLFFGVYRSGMAVNESPDLFGDPRLDRMRDYPSWDEAERRKALAWYRACLLKAAYRAERESPNPDRWIVGKNPAFSQRIPDLLKVFPEAKFIHLVRSPLETIPSRLSLVRAIWRLRLKGVTDMAPEQIAEVVADSERTYLLALRDLAGLPPERAITVKFRTLVSDLPGTLDRIYGQLRLPGTPPPVEEAGAADRKAAPHRYTLEEFGLTEADIRQRLAPVFEAYGF